MTPSLRYRSEIAEPRIADARGTLPGGAPRVAKGHLDVDFRGRKSG